MAAVFFGIVLALFLVFFVHMGISENVHVESQGTSHSYTVISEYSQERILDETAPIGIRDIYRWTLGQLPGDECCLCFYISHHHAQVYIDGELNYSLTGSEENRVGGTISSNWVSLPVHQHDSGKEITVVLTPLFSGVEDNHVEFLLGSHFSILFDQLKNDLPHLFLALLCIVLGLFILVIEGYFLLRTGSQNWETFYLGIFSILLGVSRITDAMSSPIIFSQNPMLLGYISIGTLFLTSIPLLLFMSSLFSRKKALPMLILSLVGTGICLLVLVLQVTGLADFKEMLTLSHILLISTILLIPATIILHNHRQQNNRIRSSWRLFLLLGAGIALDISFFYISGSSSDVIFTTIALILYMITMFMRNILEATKMAYTDTRTGLANKARWNEVLNEASTDGIAIVMLDLNGLKAVNDSLGHEAGDELILSFSKILRNTLPSSSVICRWGGDEFTVLLSGLTREKVQGYLDTLRSSVEEHNVQCPQLPIRYAQGCALSEDHPNLTRKELLLIADDLMYRDKEQWYRSRQ